MKNDNPCRKNFIFSEFPLTRSTQTSFVDFTLLTHGLFPITDKPEITAHPQNITKTEGENVTLSCNATGNPAPKISWIKDRYHVTNNSEISFAADNKQLTITNVRRTDSGEYRCVASNSLGNDTTSPAKLDVQCKWNICCCFIVWSRLVSYFKSRISLYKNVN